MNLKQTITAGWCMVIIAWCASATETPIADALCWPEVRAPETRPWTWWWWHGSAVTKTDITANLEALHRSGIGGVSIVNLLDVRDESAVKLAFLSQEWADAVAHAVREAHRLGMDADMSPVSGWALGGPQVSFDDACAMVEVKRTSLEACRKLGMRVATFSGDTAKPIQRNDLSAVMAKSENGVVVELTAKVDETGILHWDAPEGKWTIYTAIHRAGSSRVRMPTSGGDGWVVDHLCADAVRRYFEPYTRTFALMARGDLPRAFNNDSWEIKLNWTRDFSAEFLKRRGYDLRQYLPEFIGEGDEETVSRVIRDYRQTLSDLMVEAFTRTFDAWAAGHGRQIIGEACDEPANELDINALYDIPQADLGGPLDWYLRDGRINVMRAKLAASPAHILGKPLVSSETLTCFGPVLDTSLVAVKDKLDADMLAGINHTMLHGISYSPTSAPWPGWLFYAGFHLGDFNPLWRQQGRQLCDYITRCQSFLQQGQPQNELLVYLPIHDLWSTRATDKAGKLRRGPPTGVKTADIKAPMASNLWHLGYDYAWVSDQLLESVKVENGRFISPGGNYQALVIADCTLLPETTLKRVVQLAEQGGTIILPGNVPADVPGLARLRERRQEFHATMQRIEVAAKPLTNGIREALLGKGRILLGGKAEEALACAGLQRESFFDIGLRSIRRVDREGTTYFIVNPATNKRVDCWMPLNATGVSVVIYDPMDGRIGIARQRRSAAGGTEVFLQLDPRESCIVRVLKTSVHGNAWTYLDAGEPVTIQGPWNVKFLEGGEVIPHPETISTLTSWTTWLSDQTNALRGFSGVASYAVHFSRPKTAADDWAIDLGTVRHTTRVRLNGVVLGDRFTTPMRVVAGKVLRDGDNLLEIEVASTPLNRAADLDIKGVVWQNTLGEDAKSYRIGDFLNRYQPKEAATWQPRPSGLLGPVQLIPLKTKQHFAEAGLRP